MKSIFYSAVYSLLCVAVLITKNQFGINVLSWLIPAAVLFFAICCWLIYLSTSLPVDSSLEFVESILKIPQKDKKYAMSTRFFNLLEFAIAAGFAGSGYFFLASMLVALSLIGSLTTATLDYAKAEFTEKLNKSTNGFDVDAAAHTMAENLAQAMRNKNSEHN